MERKIYTIVDKSLTNAQKTVQSSHALLELAFNHPKIKEDLSFKNSLIMLEADFEHLLFLKDKIKDHTEYNAHFIEPYYGHKLTAISFLANENTKEYTKNLKLMIKNK